MPLTSVRHAGEHNERIIGQRSKADAAGILCKNTLRPDYIVYTPKKTGEIIQ